MSKFFAETLKKRLEALSNIRDEVARLTQLILESPMDKRASFWEKRLLHLIRLIPKKEEEIRINKKMVRRKKIPVRKIVLTPGERFSDMAEIQKLLVPTVVVLACEDNNGGLVVFSGPMGIKNAQEKLRLRPINPRLRSLMIVFHNQAASLFCSNCRQKKRLPNTNLCQDCKNLYLALDNFSASR